ncbi:MAG: helix-turn-helix domain-containing protein [Halanaeroarchaeum sp.]
MTRATLTISIPEDVWIGRISSNHPDLELTILSAFPGEETAIGLVELGGPDVSAALQAFEDEENVTCLDVLNRDEGTALIQVETTEPTLLFPIVGSGIPLELPFPIQDGEARWTVTSSHDRLSELGAQLDAFGISYTLHALDNDYASENLLTDDQRALIETAIEEGYYDVPRTCTLTELADVVGIAKSTCSEKLHRAESKIVRSFVTSSKADEAGTWQKELTSE